MSKVPPTHRPPEPARTTKAQATSRPPPAVPSEEELPPTAAHDGVGAGTGITQDRSIGAPAPPLRRNGTRTDRRRRIALVTAAVIALGAVTGSALWFFVLQDRSPGRASPAPSSTAPSSTAPGCGAINDEFNTASLAPGWEQLNGGRFAVSDGAMAITASDGADVRSDLQGAVTAPFLARTQRGDFRIETTVTVDPQYSYQGAGLLLYGDAENYVRLDAVSAAKVRLSSSTLPTDGTRNSTGPSRGTPTPSRRPPPSWGYGWCAPGNPSRDSGARPAPRPGRS